MIPGGCVYSSAGAVQHVDAGIDALDEAAWVIPCHTAGTADPLRPLLYNSGAWNRVASGEWRRYGNTLATDRAILASSSERFPYTGNVFSSTAAARWQLPAAFNATRNPSSGPARFRISRLMLPGGGSDGHMTVMQPGGKVLETYATIMLGSGEVVALSYSTTNAAGLGDGWQNGQTASMLPAYAGLIDGAELTDGIEHAIAVTLPARLLAVGLRYPAFAFDRDAITSSHPYAGIVPMGARLALPAHADLRALDLATREGTVIARAAQRYGFIVVDRGGGGITLRMRPGPMQPGLPLHCPSLGGWRSALRRDLRRIFSEVEQVYFPLPVTTAGGE